jgi:flagellar motor switch/type III secretory pathway protein FliN
VIWPTRLAPVDGGARAAATPLGRALRTPDRADAAARAWAAALECAVRVQPSPGAPPPRRVPCAAAGWRTATGAAGRLLVDAHLLAGALQVLGGAPAGAAGPVPLSPAEEGLFGYLALAWLADLPAAPALDWVHGGDPTWPAPEDGVPAVDWRVEVAGRRGIARWCLPPAPGLVSAPPPDHTPLPLGLWLDPVPLALGARLRSGDRLPVSSRVRLRGATGPIHPSLRWRHGAAQVPAADEVLPVNDSTMLEALPVRLEVHLADVVLTAGQLAALTPGTTLPLALTDPPTVRLRAGDRVVATAALVEDGGGVALQIVRVTLD